MENLNKLRTPLDAWISLKIGLGSEALTREAISQYQLVKLQETIERTYRCSPFYRARLQGFMDQKISALSDLTFLPFTTAEDLRNHGLQMLCVSQGAINRVVTLDSSGTTGEPKRIYFTAEDQELTINFFEVGMSTLAAPGDRVLILLPGERAGSVGDLLAIALERLGAIPVKHGLVKNVPETLRCLAQTQAEVAVGIPVQLLALAKYYESDSEKPPLALRRILLSTDYMSAAVVREIYRIWNCELFDHYGMTEMGLGGGIECGAHRGYHLREADLFFEIVDPVTGGVVSEGEYGEVVFTTLTRQGMPLIRYRTGDISRWLPGRCSCGTVLKRLDKVGSRRMGIVFLAESCFLNIGDLDERLLALPGVVDFTATFMRQAAGARLKIAVKTLAGTGNILSIERALERISSLQRSRQLGKLELEIEIAECGETFIPRFGKRSIQIVE